MSPLVGLVVAAKLASLHERQPGYSYRDLLALAEIAMVPGYNEWAAMASARDGHYGSGR